MPKIKLYSDGGADPNPGAGGFGVILTFKQHRKEFFGGYQLTTNNRMELMGVIYGLEQINRVAEVEVFTDSKYIVDAINKGWVKRWQSNDWYRNRKEKAINIDLWKRLMVLLETHSVQFTWIKGHNGHPENERCDALATHALNQSNLKVDIGYLPKTEKNIAKTHYNNKITGSGKIKITKIGDVCRKCETPVEKRTRRKKKFKARQTYYFE